MKTLFSHERLGYERIGAAGRGFPVSSRNIASNGRQRSLHIDPKRSTHDALYKFDERTGTLKLRNARKSM